jgi:endonuclease/exonuclease/phosphatase family metal-dependent hydrolase
MMKLIRKLLLTIILILVLAVGGLLGWLTLTEYMPAPVEALKPLRSEAEQVLAEGATLDLLSWNIGYAGLGAESDFIMDGGEDVRSADEATVKQYLSCIDAETRDRGYDFVLLQEVDTNSARTYGINEAESLAWGDSFHALNFSCPFVPNPVKYVTDPIGKVNSGLLTVSDYSVESAERISLPGPFSWPLRIANLKRCLLVSYLPIEGSDKQLVLVNLHLEAYDSGEGKIAQTEQLKRFIQTEYEKGNYVIAGGDFNQVFPGSLEVYPNALPELWEPGVLDQSMLPAGEGWQFVYSLDAPTCRLLNQPYDPEDVKNTQYYVIDGFIISPNVELVLVENLGDLDFANSDHNPVHIQVTLK